MKFVSHLVGLLIVGLVVPLITADISLKLRDQQYLPPGQDSQISSSQQKFEESKYGNAKYQQFEVHNQHGSNNERASTRNPSDNIHNPSSNSSPNEIRIEHINAPPGFPLDNPDLDASLLNVVSQVGNNNIILKHKNVKTSSNSNINIPLQFPSNYQHDFPEKSLENLVDYDGAQSNLKLYRPRQKIAQSQSATDSYLLPLNNEQVETQQYSEQVIENPFKGSEFLPPPPPQDGSSFKGPDYLPPLQVSNAQAIPFKASQYLSPADVNNPFKGPDYLPPPKSSAGQPYQEVTNSNNPFKAPGYLPPLHSRYNQESIQISNSPPSNSNDANQQGSFPPNTLFRLEDFLPPRQQQQQQNSLQHYNINDAAFGVLPPGYDFVKPPNAEEAIAELHTLPDESITNQPPDLSQETQVTLHSQIQVSGTHEQSGILNATPEEGTGPPLLGDFLPAGYDFKKVENSENQGQQAQSTAYFLPTTQTEREGRTFSGPGYLPPGYDYKKPVEPEQVQGTNYQVSGGQQQKSIPQSSTGQHQNYQSQRESFIQENKEPVFKVTAYSTSSNSPNAVNNAFKGPDYLPPPPQSAQQSTHHLSESLKGGYLPPTPHTAPQSTQQSSETFKGPGYLPPTLQSGQHSNQQSGETFKGPGYLPPIPQSAQHSNKQSSESFNNPGHLPPTSQSAQHSNQQSTESFKVPGYLPPNPQSAQQSNQQSTESFKSPGYLPPTRSSAQQSNQQISESFKGPDYLPPTEVPQTGSTQTFKGPDYLPPTRAAHIFNNLAFKDTKQLSNLKAPDNLAPKATATHASPPSQSTFLHSLSSYMTNVQPFERYGSTRKPFLDYGPPSTFSTGQVAPMYREAASRPQYYAPAMSYATNGISSQVYNSHAETHVTQSKTLRQQAREALQTFMPQEIRQGNTPYRTGGNIVSSSSSTAIPKVPILTPKLAKIRTVQIVNSNDVKTLRVLESLDHTGVKTIKILGPSSATPMGQHRVVKVVSGNEQNIQTVKIYNDQQDYEPERSLANNDYLSPRHKRHPKKIRGKGNDIPNSSP